MHVHVAVQAAEAAICWPNARGAHGQVAIGQLWPRCFCLTLGIRAIFRPFSWPACASSVWSAASTIAVRVDIIPDFLQWPLYVVIAVRPADSRHMSRSRVKLGSELALDMAQL